MLVEMISIGDELIARRGADRNAVSLAALLRSHGLALWRRQTVPDELDTIVDALRTAAARAGLVVVSGGLGPTSDDLTRDAVGALLAVPVAEDPEAAAAVRARRAARGLAPNPGERRMARLPRGAALVANEAGVAPGFAVEHGGTRLVFLPGVPSEFEAMLPAALAPTLPGPGAGAAGRSCAVSVFGVPESELDERLRPLERPPALRVRYGVRFPTIRVTLEAQGEEAEPARWTESEARFRALVGDAAYADGEATLAETVVAGLKARGWHLATAESCTGGLVSHLLTEVPGVSAHFGLGLVTYANEAKRDLLGVPESVLATHGAVSRETVEHMARGVRERAGAELGVAISGIAGPEGGSPAKPVGTVHFALDTPDGARWIERRFRGTRSEVKLQAAHAALDLIRRYLEGQKA